MCALQHLPRGLLVAVDQQVAALRTPVAQDAKARARQADVPRAAGTGTSRTAEPAEANARNCPPRSLPLLPGGLLVLGLLAARISARSASRRAPAHALARDGLHFFVQVKRLLLACQASSAPPRPASRRERLVQKTDPSRSGLLPARPCPQDTRWPQARTAPGWRASIRGASSSMLIPRHGGVQHRHVEPAPARPPPPPTPHPCVRRRGHRISQPPQIRAHHLQQGRLVVDDQDASGRRWSWVPGCMIALCDSTRNI